MTPRHRSKKWSFAQTGFHNVSLNVVIFRRCLRLPGHLLWLLLCCSARLIGLQHERPVMGGLRLIDVTAAIPEAGGFQPDSIQVRSTFVLDHSNFVHNFLLS